MRKGPPVYIPAAYLFLMTSFLERLPVVLTSGSALDFRAPVAQRIEHLPSKQRAAGSSPAGGTMF